MTSSRFPMTPTPTPSTLITSPPSGNPLLLSGLGKHKESREMVGVEFVFSSGSSPGNTGGVALHAFCLVLTITIDWLQPFMDEDSIYKYYKPEELKMKTRSSCWMPSRSTSSALLKQFSEICKKTTVIIDLPFEVIETLYPHIKSVYITSTRTLTIIRLANVKEPTFKKAQVKQDVLYDD